MSYSIPFLSYIVDTKNNTSKYGLINLISKNTMSYYAIEKLNMDEYENFMELANNWWKTSPIIPISVYYHYDFKKFEKVKEVIFDNNYKIVKGFSGVSLNNLTDKRIKRHLVNVDLIARRKKSNELKNKEK